MTGIGGEFARRRLDRAGIEQVPEPRTTGVLDPSITATHPLARAAEAPALVKTQHVSGRVVIDMTL
ncbi:hypothetical protein [Pseudonocardia sp. NPDC046786]|uniref:hypothetical protein n=1 Tax=Pseudonocardia sp. NPDC046786 TaxID=3155471 RepID=UPI0033C080D9